MILSSEEAGVMQALSQTDARVREAQKLIGEARIFINAKIYCRRQSPARGIKLLEVHKDNCIAIALAEKQTD